MMIILKGQKASKGYAKGKVKKIDEGAGLNTVFEKGWILVTPATYPEMLHIILKASAIVTSEGGILSHAAIVSREFGIPCIVNVKDAMEKIKDGATIEVDAEVGEVRVLDENN
ncbi:MAG: hypothetical protein JXA43_00200 [Candidatus Diapherotrites archaeon]|nr:hypothetical protein [Candidatus Diapherotrites archaeon]